MSDAEQADRTFDELVKLVKESFPDLRCLRCGHDQFYMATDVDALGTGKPGQYRRVSLHTLLSDPDNPVITLACTRCGHLEHHMTGVLRRADKPIVEERSDG